MNLAELKSRFHIVRGLKHNWDQEGAEPIPAGAVDAAENFISCLPNNLAPVQTPEIKPSPWGSVEIIWKRSTRELWIEFEDGGLIFFLMWDPRVTERGGMIHDVKEIPALMRWMMTGRAAA